MQRECSAEYIQVQASMSFLIPINKETPCLRKKMHVTHKSMVSLLTYSTDSI